MSTIDPVPPPKPEGNSAKKWLIGCLVVLVCTLAMIAGITWGGGRINNTEPTDSEAEYQPSAQS